MTLIAVQKFLTFYQRDAEFRRRFRESGVLEIDGLNAEEERLIKQIKLDYLDKRAWATLSERMKRTGSAFAALFDQLEPFVDVRSLYQEYDRQHTRGWWQRKAEIRRFEAFVLDFIVQHGLPDHLIDVCRFCSHTTIVAETPKIAPPPNADLSGITSVKGNYQVVLRQPFEVVTFRYNILALIENPDSEPTPTTTELLIQRNWSRHKRSRAYPLQSSPVLAEIVRGSATVFELSARIPRLSYSALLSTVADLYNRDIVHLVVPAEIAGDLGGATENPTAKEVKQQ